MSFGDPVPPVGGGGDSCEAISITGQVQGPRYNGKRLNPVFDPSDTEKNDSAEVFFIELSLGAKIPNGTIVLGHRVDIPETALETES